MEKVEEKKGNVIDTQKIFDDIRAGRAKADFENPPQLTDEEKKKIAIQRAAKQDIIRRANEYIKTPVPERAGKKHLLAEIQEIVDTLDDAFVLVVNQKDGAPYSITFNPKSAVPEDPSANSPADSLDKRDS